MNKLKKSRLTKVGFRIGTVQEFLGLSDEEMALIDLKIRLIEILKTARNSAGITQNRLAKLIGSTHSRIAKMEAAGDDISLDLICKALFALGISQQSLGKMIASKRAA